MSMLLRSQRNKKKQTKNIFSCPSARIMSTGFHGNDDVTHSGWQFQYVLLALIIASFPLAAARCFEAMYRN